MEKKKQEKYSNKTFKNRYKKKSLVDIKWIITIGIITFLISLLFSFIGEIIIPNAQIYISFILLLLFIFLGILFDIIGISVTVSDLKVFNSMATKRVKGAKLGRKLIKNADKVSSFCNDVIGDICGIVSGSTGITIALILAEKFNFSVLILSLIITTIISTLTIVGKAIGKTFAMNKSNWILYKVVSIISIFYKEK